MNKFGARLTSKAKKYKIRLTVKREGKRVYKTHSVLQKDIRKKEGRKKRARRANRSQFGVWPSDGPPLVDLASYYLGWNDSVPTEEPYYPRAQLLEFWRVAGLPSSEEELAKIQQELLEWGLLDIHQPITEEQLINLRVYRGHAGAHLPVGLEGPEDEAISFEQKFQEEFLGTKIVPIDPDDRLTLALEGPIQMSPHTLWNIYGNISPDQYDWARRNWMHAVNRQRNKLIRYLLHSHAIYEASFLEKNISVNHVFPIILNNVLWALNTIPGFSNIIFPGGFVWHQGNDHGHFKRKQRRKVHFGSRGGRYVIKNGKKKYL